MKLLTLSKTRSRYSSTNSHPVHDSGMNSESNNPLCELVHHNQHRIGPQRGRFAAKEIDTPQAVSGEFVLMPQLVFDITRDNVLVLLKTTRRLSKLHALKCTFQLYSSQLETNGNWRDMCSGKLLRSRAGDGDRTRDVQLGKLAIN